MKDFNTDLLIYNPTLRFRNEKNRCVAYTVDAFFHNTENVTILSPQSVIKLLLFDGTADFATTAEKISYVFSPIENNKIDTMYKLKKDIEILEKRMNFSPLLIPINIVTEDVIEKTRNRYKISDFFINNKDINLNIDDLRISSPLSVNFNVSNSCKFNCKYCYHPLSPLKEFIRIDRLTQIFKELKEINCESILLAGGDPMLRKDIIDIMTALYQTGLFYIISTKSILTETQIKKMIYNAGFDRIQLSIDSLNINVVKYLLGITDDSYLKNMIKMIEILLKNNVDIRVKAVLTAFNASGMKEFLLFWKKLGIRHIQIVQYGRTPFRHTDDLFCTNEQFKGVKQIVNEFKTLYPDFHLVDDDFCSEYRQPVAEKNHDERLFFSNRGICNAGRFSLTMLQNGEVFICENLPYKKEFVLGDLREQSVMEYWNIGIVIE